MYVMRVLVLLAACSCSAVATASRLATQRTTTTLNDGFSRHFHPRRLMTSGSQEMSARSGSMMGSATQENGASEKKSGSMMSGSKTSGSMMSGSKTSGSMMSGSKASGSMMSGSKASGSMMSMSMSRSDRSSTAAPSIVETVDPSMIETIDPSDVTTTAPGDSKPDTPPPGDTVPPVAPGDCQDNPQDYNVNVDVQIEFLDDEFAACDSAEQDSSINAIISNTLNTAFPTTVSDWQGTALFGEFVFDPDQEVNNVNPFERWRARRTLSVSQKQGGRRTQEGTCPSRDFIECTADYCRWGCVTAATTDCGTSVLTSWANLAEDIRVQLAALGYDCLGIADQLQVVVLVDDPEASGRSTGDPNTILTQGDNGETENDATTTIITLNSQLDFVFLGGQGGTSPSQEEIDGLVDQTKRFFSDFLSSPDTGTGEDFRGFDMLNMNTDYQDDSDPVKFTMAFVAEVELDLATSQTVRAVATLMSKANFQQFISEYVWESEPWERSEFHETHSVFFRATGRGGRL